MRKLLEEFVFDSSLFLLRVRVLLPSPFLSNISSKSKHHPLSRKVFRFPNRKVSIQDGIGVPYPRKRLVLLSSANRLWIPLRQSMQNRWFYVKNAMHPEYHSFHLCMWKDCRSTCCSSFRCVFFFFLFQFFCWISNALLSRKENFSTFWNSSEYLL